MNRGEFMKYHRRRGLRRPSADRAGRLQPARWPLWASVPTTFLMH